MRLLISIVAFGIACSVPATKCAAAESSTQSASIQVELAELLERTAPRLKKNFIVDPRAQGRAMLVNVDVDRISYEDLKAILSVHGLVAIEQKGGLVRVVPDDNARQLPMPVLGSGSASVGDAEFVTKRIDVGPLSAAQLVPILRPMLPQQAHLVAHGETNSLIVVARNENVQMIEAIVRDLRNRPVVAQPEPPGRSKP